MLRPLNDGHPQFGIIMAVSGNTAQVFLPLGKFETDFIKSTVSLDASKIGSEVIVVFANGDRNQGVIIGVVQ